MNFRHRLLPSLLLFFVVAFPAYAQGSTLQVHEDKLTGLYRSLLLYPDDVYLKKRITDERTRVRTAIEQEIRESLQPKEDAKTDHADESAVEQQRATVSMMEELLKARKVDRDLLQAEEEKYYRGENASATGALEEYRLARSREELLAKGAIAEEWTMVLESALSLEEERLTKLSRDQKLEQFSNVIRGGTSIGIIILLLLLERFLRGVITKRIPQIQKRYVVSKIITTTVYVSIIIWVLTSLFAEHPGILTSLAIVGAGLTVALQDIVKDIVGWILIIQKRLYSPGERIAVGSFSGDVVDISLLRTTMLEVQSSPLAGVQERTGGTLSLPNALVLTNDIVNFHRTSDFVKSEIKLTLTLESHWEKSEQILRDILEEVTGKYTEAARKQYAVRTRNLFTQQEPAAPQVYLEIVGDGIEVTLRFTIPIGMRRDIGSEIQRAILQRFAAEDDIALAYRTSMVYNPEFPPPNLYTKKKRGKVRTT